MPDIASPGSAAHATASSGEGRTQSPSASILASARDMWCSSSARSTDVVREPHGGSYDGSAVEIDQYKDQPGPYRGIGPLTAAAPARIGTASHDPTARLPARRAEGGRTCSMTAAEHLFADRSSNAVFVLPTELVAETPVRRITHQPGEGRTGHVDERRVVSAFEIDVGLLGDAVVDDRGDAIGRADRRDGAAHAVREQ